MNYKLTPENYNAWTEFKKKHHILFKYDENMSLGSSEFLLYAKWRNKTISDEKVISALNDPNFYVIDATERKNSKKIFSTIPEKTLKVYNNDDNDHSDHSEWQYVYKDEDVLATPKKEEKLIQATEIEELNDKYSFFCNNNSVDELHASLYSNEKKQKVKVPTLKVGTYTLLGFKIIRESVIKTSLIKKLFQITKSFIKDFIVVDYAYPKSNAIVQETTRIPLNQFSEKYIDYVSPNYTKHNKITGFDLHVVDGGFFLYVRMVSKSNGINKRMFSTKIFISSDDLFPFIVKKFLKNHHLYNLISEDAK